MVRLAALADGRAVQEVARVKLDARLRRVDRQHPARLGRIDARGQGQRAGRGLFSTKLWS